MIYSMTGFGRAEEHKDTFQIVVELKSLNGKQLDLNTRLSSLLRPYEGTIRNIIQENLQRGTIDLSITVKENGLSKPMQVNLDLAKSYYQSIQRLAQELKLSQENILTTLLNLPEVVAASAEQLEETHWLAIKNTLVTAIAQFQQHRILEGESLFKDLSNCIAQIEKGLNEILPLEPLRIEKLRQRINTNLAELIPSANIDNNRFEQEMIYYIEKIDFSEEKIRLQQHCTYFKEVLQSVDMVKGKKLGFILQEVGREINTLGSKANDADIQKIIVQMKDYLEKAKEQVLNVL